MPTKPATRLDYGRRIARAMAHVGDCPDRTPTPEELAAVAAFSPCHFHRIYRAMAGETPAETLARARLSRAAVELLRSGAPVARVARRAGAAALALPDAARGGGVNREAAAARAGRLAVRVRMARRDATYAQLAERLAGIGVEENEWNLRNKVSRSKFTAGFLLQAMTAIGAKGLRLDEAVRSQSPPARRTGPHGR